MRSTDNTKKNTTKSKLKAGCLVEELDFFQVV